MQLLRKWRQRPIIQNTRIALLQPSRLRNWLFGSFIFVMFAIFLFFGLHMAFGTAAPYSRHPKQPLIVHLPNQGTYQGTQILTTLNHHPLDKVVDSWLNIQYATQPIGEKRFAPVTWPEPFEGIREASSYGPICIQNPNSTKLTQSEACLNMNVYRTTGLPLTEKLPVLVWIHGGSFVGGSGQTFDGAGFVAASNVSIMVVTLQYRLGALGSLPSALFEEEGLLNLGLLDQKMCLEFIHRYITHFGGNEDAITLGGQSAGGHSVGLHYFHNYGLDTGKPLFHQVILSSGSPTARAFPNATYPLYQHQFTQFMNRVNCPTAPNKEALSCLRAVDISKIQYVQAKMYSASEYNITWPFQPVAPGPLIEKRGSKSGEDGTFFHLPLLSSSTTDEGKGFAPGNLKTNSDFLDFLHNLAPGMTAGDLNDFNTLYPDPALAPDVNPYTNSPNSTQYNRISAAYGDYAYICPTQETAYRLSSASVPVYKARFNTPQNAKSWQGIPHASDSKYFNGLPDAEFPDVAKLYQSYYASFVASGDPNTHAIEGAAKWEAYSGVGSGELVVGNQERGGTYMEKEGSGIRMAQCAWWRDVERMARLNK